MRNANLTGCTWTGEPSARRRRCWKDTDGDELGPRPFENVKERIQDRERQREIWLERWMSEVDEDAGEDNG